MSHKSVKPIRGLFDVVHDSFKSLKRFGGSATATIKITGEIVYDSTGEWELRAKGRGPVLASGAPIQAEAGGGVKRATELVGSSNFQITYTIRGGAEP